MTSVSTFSNIGATTINESNWASGYASNRITTLINEGYSVNTSEQMTYLEIGLTISLDLINSKLIQAGSTEIGGDIGIFAGDLLAGPAGGVVGKWIGNGLGWMAGGQISSWLDQQIAQKMSEQIFDKSGNVLKGDIDLGKLSYISNPMKGVQNGFNQAEVTQPVRYDPIIFDLNGDGIKTTTIANGTYFDHANDGYAESTAWVDNNDGILVTDTNANGKIDNGTVDTFNQAMAA